MVPVAKVLLGAGSPNLSQPPWFPEQGRPLLSVPNAGPISVHNRGENCVPTPMAFLEDRKSTHCVLPCKDPMACAFPLLPVTWPGQNAFAMTHCNSL